MNKKQFQEGMREGQNVTREMLGTASKELKRRLQSNPVGRAFLLFGGAEYRGEQVSMDDVLDAVFGDEEDPPSPPSSK